MKATDVRSTPDWLFNMLNELHGPFELDVAADEDNAKCPDWFGPGSPSKVEDGLEVEWPTDVAIWMNPPYSRGQQRKWIEKAVDCARRGGTVVALLPADTSTRVFHELIWKRFPIEFLNKRIKFNGNEQGAKFGSMVVVFTKRPILERETGEQ